MDISLLSLLALVISLYQFFLLFDSIGHIIPTRHLLGSFMCIQFFVGPTLVYNGLEKYQYFMYWMRIPELQYFEYVIPAVALFIIGLHINAGNYKGEVVDKKKVELFIQRNPKIPYLFIIIGFLASIVAGYFGSELGFVFYLLGSFKFIGLFLLVLGTRQIKIWALVLVIGSIISSSLANGMFHDLLTWIIFMAAIFGIKYKFDFKIKIIGLSALIFIVIVIQALKGSFRTELSANGGNNGAQAFSKLYEEKNEQGGFLNIKSLGESVTRINQGFIITNIMITVPDLVPFSNGEEMRQILEAAILPRILAPDKLKAGDKSIFEKYSHIPLGGETSMGLSSIGDAYINFGILGGVAFMFVLGWFYSAVLNSFHKNSFKYPVLILFVPLVFYYPIRPDCELQTILTHLFKSCFLIFVIIQVWKYKFRVPQLKMPAKLAQA
ncbi:MAG TPA: hypothetical protein VGP55_04330 [Chitinophagaceae bacterium]|nr:hypothetical protein [Chitinophagaceae bacterium]